MRKKALLFGTAVMASMLGISAYADDVVVRTSVGSGEVIFTETDEDVAIDEEELDTLVKSSLDSIKEEDIDIFVDADIDGTLNFGEGAELPIKASLIGSIDKFLDNVHTSIHYNYNAMGSEDEGSYEAYTWLDGDKKLTAVFNEDDEEEWSVSSTDAGEDGILDSVEENSESFKISGLQPKLYEENGQKYYVCLYDLATLVETAGDLEMLQGFDSMVTDIVGDNEVTAVVVINAETGLPRAISINASEAEGTIPGDIFGVDAGIPYSVPSLYATVLFDDNGEEVVIPEEVLSAPVEELSQTFEDLGNSLVESLTGETEGELDVAVDVE